MIAREGNFLRKQIQRLQYRWGGWTPARKEVRSSTSTADVDDERQKKNLKKLKWSLQYVTFASISPGRRR